MTLTANAPVHEFAKDPDAILDYSLDWTEWLDGDTILTSDWDVASGLTLDHDEFSGLVTVAWLAGGTAGETYLVTNQVTTLNGRTDDRTIRIAVVER